MTEIIGSDNIIWVTGDTLYQNGKKSFTVQTAGRKPVEFFTTTLNTLALNPARDTVTFSIRGQFFTYVLSKCKITLSRKSLSPALLEALQILGHH